MIEEGEEVVLLLSQPQADFLFEGIGPWRAQEPLGARSQACPPLGDLVGERVPLLLREHRRVEEAANLRQPA